MDAIGHRGDCEKANEASTVGLQRDRDTKPVLRLTRSCKRTLHSQRWDVDPFPLIMGFDGKWAEPQVGDRRLCVERGPTNEVHVFPLPSLSTCSSYDDGQTTVMIALVVFHFRLRCN
jgi:hypothetical protein